MTSKPYAVCILATLLAAGSVLGAQAAAEGRIDSAGLKPALGGKAAVSQCAKDCIEKAKQLGYEKVVADSMACFMPYKGKQLSHADCCDKAELLFGRHGTLAHCMCCPEFVKELLQAAPLEKLEATHDEYLEKMNLCRVPLVSTAGCSPSVAKERAPLPIGSNGPMFSPLSFDRPLVQQLNLTGVYPAVGFPTKFTSTLLAAQGRAAIAEGQISRINVIGASDFFNEYMTGFMMLIERETPRYPTPKRPNLPPLPKQYQEDVAWVASLRRGPVPDLIKNRPQQFSPKATDPLQNGEIANMSPGVVFAGRVSALNRP